MTVFTRLIDAYGTEGLEVMSGLNATLVQDFFQAPFTWLVRDGRSVTDGLGVSPVEVYFLEGLAAVRPARRILVIGNAFGWSTLALALANPGAKVVAIDAGYDDNAIEGLAVTNRLARRLGVDVLAVQATSPSDVADVVTRRLDAVDLAFIDGFHVSEQLVADWRAVRPFLHTGSLVLMHDVLLCDLVDGYRRILSESGWKGSLLHATTSGIAVLGHHLDGELGGLLAAFSGSPRARRVVEEAAAEAAGVPGHAQRDAALRYLRQTWRDRETAQEVTPGGLGVRRWRGSSVTYRVGTTDEVLFDDDYGQVRFFPEGFDAGRAGTIIDAGAHIGAFTVLAAQRVPDGAVYALEPGRGNRMLLERNVTTNDAANVRVHQVALAGAGGTVRLHHAPGSIGHSLYKNPRWEGAQPEPGVETEAGAPGYEDVACVTLEQFMLANEVEQVDLLKMNIEGAEYDVLRTTPPEILRRIRWMQIELHPTEDSIAEAALDRLRSAGFEVKTILTDHPDVRGWATARRTSG